MAGNRHISNNYKKNSAGMALILSILILSNLFIVSFIIADIIIRIGKTGHEIGQSEIAYLAAETAIEESIYTIESARDIIALGTYDSPTNGDMDYSGGSWSRYATVITSLRVTCIDGNLKVTYPDVDPDDGDSSCIYSEVTGADITNSNDLKIHLQNGKSFQLELDVSGAGYPGFLVVSWQNKHFGQIVALDLNEDADDIQTIYDTNDIKQCNIPKIGSLNGRQRLRITNKSGHDIIYTIEPSLSDNALPIGVLLHTRGDYNNQQERTIEVERRNWQIYY